MCLEPTHSSQRRCVILRCGHVGHYDCLQKSWQHNRAMIPKCPTCRKSLLPPESMKVYWDAIRRSIAVQPLTSEITPIVIGDVVDSRYGKFLVDSIYDAPEPLPTSLETVPIVVNSVTTPATPELNRQPSRSRLGLISRILNRGHSSSARIIDTSQTTRVGETTATTTITATTATAQTVINRNNSTPTNLTTTIAAQRDRNIVVNNMNNNPSLAVNQHVVQLCSGRLISWTMSSDKVPSATIRLTDLTKDLRILIICNDCEKRSHAQFHFLGMECRHCQGFNTTRF